MKRTIWVVLGCVAGIATLWRTFVATPPGRELDQLVMVRLGEVPASWAVAAAWTGAVIAPVVALAAVVLVLLAVSGRRRRRYRVALLAIGGSVVTSEVLKLVLPRPGLDDGPMGNSFPSGHVAAIAAVVVVAVLLAPVGVRAIVAGIGSVVVSAAGLAVVVLQWHRPSDVAAAVLVAVGWGALASVLTDVSGAVRRVVQARPPRRRMAVATDARS
ncbi:phosphatase PAP2 family protein [Raineyella sp. W15-4]|uniref:phosphatase PAP2 family protein n=1 Tax=Raineyella sp. W15-4 TaxID=3081651 RepID=UPI00295596BB|nr:phosphatase PAP2 family protein [Raineyella sp. W15-4]WOQ17245.1 phosphatase PAP2 family protein [Raineyella sp. W15-4]